MSSRNHNFLVVSSLAAAGAGLAATAVGWLNGYLGNDENNRNDGEQVAQIAHPKNSSLREILDEHQRRQTLVSRYARPEEWNEYTDKSTFFGFTLQHGLEAGLLEKEGIFSNIGFVAGDGDAYTLFPKILNPLIEFLHGVHLEINHASSINPRELDFDNLDPRYVVSCRVRVLRSLRGFPFAWRCSEMERREIEDTAVGILETIPGYDPSTYVKLSALNKPTRDIFLKNNYIFYPYVNELDATWPSGRGIWYGDHGSVVVLINEQEHLKFISQLTGSDVKSVFNRLRNFVNITEQFFRDNAHDFSFDEKYGHLTSSPREIGTGFRVSMNVRLPRLSQEPRLAFILRLLALEKRQPGITAEHGHGVMELSNTTRTAYTEVDFIQHVVSGIRHLIAMERLLKDGHVIDPVLCAIIRNNINDLLKRRSNIS